MISREADDVVRVYAEVKTSSRPKSIYRRGKTQGEFGMASGAAKCFELLKNRNPRTTTGDTRGNDVRRGTHMLIRVPVVMKSWETQ